MPVTGAIRVTGLNEIAKDFKEFGFAIPAVQAKFLKLIGDSALALLKANTPVMTGELKNSWGIVSQSMDRIGIGVTQQMQGVLQLVRKGSPPHVIFPTQAKVLRFEIGGQEIFATQVFHPGFLRNDFVSNVARAMNALVIETLNTSWVLHSKLYREARKSGTIRSTGAFRQTSNLTRTVGLSKFGAGRAFGRATLVRARTGRRQFKRKLVLRRRRGASINSLKVQAKIKGLGK